MKQSKSEGNIARFYSEYPFPNVLITEKVDLYKTLIYELIHGLSCKYLDKYENKKMKILDAGCGTGELTLGLSDGKRDILGIDINQKSLEIARARAKKFRITKVKFKKFNFAKEELPKNYYDFIFSIGVLHHTHEPEKNFNKLVKALKKGGFITIGIYNPYGSFKVRLIRGLLNIIAGDNFEKKIEIYRRLFYRRELTITEKVAVADAFANPYRRYYTFEQLLKWFEKNNIQYLDSAPSIELSKNIKLIKIALRNILEGKRLSLMSIWQDIMYKHESAKKWEISKPIAILTQLSWAIIGRGELINIVGRKK